MPNNGYLVNPGTGQSIAYLDRKLYLFGTDGENAFKSKSKYNFAFKVYDLDSQFWTLNFTSETNRTIELIAHNLIAVNETLYVLGGYNTNSGVGNNEIFKVNLTDFSIYSLSTQNYSSFRANTVIIQFNDSLIVSGGRTEYEIKNEIYQLVISPYSLKILSEETLSPQSRKNSLLFTFSSYIYMLGGSTSKS